ncbi:MAG: Sensor histidine kinase CssS [Syntrophomonadaceae bacterium]|nr:Sensor histidine kinase CssS [Bacillota bacterium]
MKNKPLFIQIWLVFTLFSLVVFLSLAGLFPRTLRDFFTWEIYATIENAQELALNRASGVLPGEVQEIWPSGDRPLPVRDIRTVRHFVISGDTPPVGMLPLPSDFISEVQAQARNQKTGSQRYSGRVLNRKIFYVITREDTLGQPAFLISYMWDTYREGLVRTLFARLTRLMVFVFLFSWLLSFWLARYLSRPLVTLEQQVHRIARRDWHEPVRLPRKDEIGRLGASIEKLRTQLLRHDEDQRSFLQHISHELKTPVMVIRAFAQSIRDGIFPKGDLAGSLQVIDEAAERLEKRIRSLLYLNKLDYLESRKPEREHVDLHLLAEEVADLFRWRRAGLDWRLSFEPVAVSGDREQLRIALENLLDNQLRYAKSNIAVTVQKKAGHVVIQVWNDGPAIEPAMLETLFEKFQKGYKGEFGLGLAIARRIADLHGAKVSVANENEGVSFTLEFPTQDNLTES